MNLWLNLRGFSLAVGELKRSCLTPVLKLTSLTFFLFLRVQFELHFEQTGLVGLLSVGETCLLHSATRELEDPLKTTQNPKTEGEKPFDSKNPFLKLNPFYTST